MRPALRAAAFFAALGLALLVAAGAASLLAVFLAVPSTAARLSGLVDHPWWFAYAPSGQQPAGWSSGPPMGWNGPSPLWSVAAALAASAVALPAILRARALAPRASPAVALFLSVFLFSLCAEGLRASAAYLAATDASVAVAVALTRVVYAGRFLGLLALLALGLYSMEMKYGRHLLLATGMLAIAVAVGLSIPVDRTVFLAQLTFKLGDEQSLWFASLVLSVVVVAAGAGAALTRRRGPSLLALAGTILLLGGREMLSFAARPVPVAAGAAMLAAGAALWLRAEALAGNPGRGEAARSGAKDP